MKTYLISQEQIKQFVMLLVVAMLAVFFAGYYLGGQGLMHASVPGKSIDTTNTVGTEVDTRILENPPIDVKDNVEKAKSDQNEKTQKNKAANTPLNKNAEQQAIERKKADKKKAEEKARKKAAAKKQAAKEEAAKEEAARKKASQKDQASKGAALKQSEKTPQLSVAGSANLKPGQRYYSIQAGMFASKVNASSFIDKLAEKDFKAYVSNFISTSGAVKYNVRVGRFEKRDQARVLLREFQKHFSSPAYVVISDR